MNNHTENRAKQEPEKKETIFINPNSNRVRPTTKLTLFCFVFISQETEAQRTNDKRNTMENDPTMNKINWRLCERVVSIVACCDQRKENYCNSKPVAIIILLSFRLLLLFELTFRFGFVLGLCLALQLCSGDGHFLKIEPNEWNRKLEFTQTAKEPIWIEIAVTIACFGYTCEFYFRFGWLADWNADEFEAVLVCR